MTQKVRLYAMGAALVDIIARVPEDFLYDHRLEPGQMHLSTLEQARSLYAAVGQAQEIAGGSSANTAAIAANLGADVTFIGKVAHDQLGDIFAHDMKAQGVDLLVMTMKKADCETGRCLSLITPDGQRTMSTFLGASTRIEVEEVKQMGMGNAHVDDWLFLETYMLDSENGQACVRHMLDVFPGKIALTLSDPRCVERHRSLVHNMLADVDLVFGNETEVDALFEEGTFLENIETLGRQGVDVVCTHGPKGVYTFTKNNLRHQPAAKAVVVDTTGAGDSFAGAVLTGLMEGKNLEEAAGMGVRVAAHIIGQVGARPMGSLRDVL